MHRILLLLGLIISGCQSTTSIEHKAALGQDTRIKSLVIHFTAINFARSMRALSETSSVSSHYLLPESNDSSYPHSKLRVFRLVNEQDRAWHAGTSYWQERTDLNDTSIGIEIVNVPNCVQLKQFDDEEHKEFSANRFCQFPDYDPAQMKLLIDLIQGILKRHPGIKPTQIVGHSDIAPMRKNDPGPRFPWLLLYQNGIGAWYDMDTFNFYWHMFSNKAPDLSLIQKALSLYGYKIETTGELDSQTEATLYAFQSHFLPTNLTGLADIKTAAAIFALLDKYHQERAAEVLKLYFN